MLPLRAAIGILGSEREKGLYDSVVKGRSKFIKYIPIILIGFFISALYVYLMSFSTSPLFPYYFGGDSAQFQTIGKAWYFGKIPYRDMFDHKGPVIFFINMLGFSITKSSAGIMFIQIIFMFGTLTALFKLNYVVSKNIAWASMSAVLALGILTLIYGGGNTVEEYCLPFNSFSLYLQYKYFFNKKSPEGHPPICALVYGISFAVCLATRVTNAIIICTGVLVISISLMHQKAYKNIFFFFFAFIIGVLLIVLPFCVYFYQLGLFKELCFAAIGYNLEYQAHMTPWIFSANIRECISWGLQYFVSYSIFLTGIFALRRKQFLFFMFCIITGILEMYLFLSGARFSQYAIVTLPQFILLINEIEYLAADTIKNLLIKAVSFASVIFISGYSFLSCVSQPITMHNIYSDPPSYGYEQLLDAIPREERTEFVAYGANIFKELYLLHDLLPCYKYFVIQEWHASFSEKVRCDLYKTFKSGDAKWILTDGNCPSIQDILAYRYELYLQNDSFKLYQLKEDNICQSQKSL